MPRRKKRKLKPETEHTHLAVRVEAYLAWRDTKCAILLFNRNRNFSQVLAQLKPTLKQHAQFVSFDGSRDETEFAFTFKRADDPDRRLNLTVLAFDIPAEPT